MRQKLRPGDFVKCTNCKNYYKMFVCDNCTELHPESVNKRDVIVEVAMKWCVCPHCGTGAELIALRNHIRTMQRGLLN